MTGCDRLSDRMPSVALGRARWTPAEEAHLADCEDCRVEWGLVRAAGRLAGSAPAIADEAALTAGVLRRLHGTPATPVRRGGRVRWAAGVAAAATIGLGLWATLRPDGSATRSIADADVAVTLTEAQVDSLLEEGDPPLAGWSMLESPTLGDLDAEELERVLRTWEG